MSRKRSYAAQRRGLRCHWDFPNLSAVRFVYRYVFQLKARLQMIGPKLSKSAPQWQKIQWKFWINHKFKSAFRGTDLLPVRIPSQTPMLNRIPGSLIPVHDRLRGRFLLVEAKLVQMCTGSSAAHKVGANVYRSNKEVIFWRYQYPARYPGQPWTRLLLP